MSPKGSSDYDVVLRKPLDPQKVLRRSDCKVIEQIWNEFGSWDKDALVDYCHKLPEYDQRAWMKDEKSSFPMSYKTFLLGAGFSPDEADAAAAEHALFG